MMHCTYAKEDRAQLARLQRNSPPPEEDSTRNGRVSHGCLPFDDDHTYQTVIALGRFRFGDEHPLLREKQGVMIAAILYCHDMLLDAWSLLKNTYFHFEGEHKMHLVSFVSSSGLSSPIPQSQLKNTTSQLCVMRTNVQSQNQIDPADRISGYVFIPHSSSLSHHRLTMVTLISLSTEYITVSASSFYYMTQVMKGFSSITFQANVQLSFN
ncbi:hypothetical protein F5146DRAFT_1076047 [Armillaria mellea]|nr:hypothetical protein F5146DRAFT_1076047 [Armillaria mellea]